MHSEVFMGQVSTVRGSAKQSIFYIYICIYKYIHNYFIDVRKKGNMTKQKLVNGVKY